MGRFGLAIVLVGVLVLAGAAGASAAPFAYVYSGGFIAVVSVIDTATNTVVATVAVPPAHGIGGPVGVAVAPDGAHVYVNVPCGLSVIDTATNTVVTTVGLPILPPPLGSCSPSGGVAVAPDGAHVYVTTFLQIVVIDTATNAVVKTIPLCCTSVGNASLDINPIGIAVTPDGARVYVTGGAEGPSSGVAVIDTATNAVVARVPLPSSIGIAVTPDGAHVYVSTQNITAGTNAVMVIATATNTVVATVGFPPSAGPSGIAVSPDGARVYVGGVGACIFLVTCDGLDVAVIDTATNTVVAHAPTDPCCHTSGVAVTPDGTRLYALTGGTSGVVRVFDTVTNTLVATVQVPSLAAGIGIQPVTSFAFATFSAKVDISLSTGSFDVNSTFTLGAGSRGINPLTQPVTLKVGAFTATIPAGSFLQNPQGFVFGGIINGVALEVIIVPLGGNSFAFRAQGTGVSNLPTTNPVTVGLTIGNNAGTTTVTSDIQ